MAFEKPDYADPNLEAGSMVDEKQHDYNHSHQSSAAPTLNEHDSPKNARRNTMSSVSTVEEAEPVEDYTEAQLAELAIEAGYESQLCANCKNPTQADLERIITRTKTNKSAAGYNYVTWDGPDDPQNPRNMTFARRWAIVATTGLMTFTVSFASSVFSTTTFVTAAKFNVSSEVMLLGLSLYVCGFAAGPMVWGPMSEAFGRSRPMFFGMVCFCIFQIPVAVATNLETIFICRFLAGCFGSAPLAILGGMFVDFMEPVERGVATAVFAGAVFAGPVAGPVMGSFITHSYLGWRWTAWITLIMGAFFTIVAYITTPETYEPLLLRWKAERLRRETKDWTIHARSEEDDLALSTVFSKYLLKPLQMIVAEPILIILTLYMSLVYGILYLTFEAYPISFEFNRGWSPGLASLPFISIFIGVVLACAVIAVYTNTYYAKRMAITKRLNPEDRLPPMVAGSIILPIGLFWFAWTSNPHINPWPQIISGVFIGLGIILIFMSGVVYIIDVYLFNANSATAINTFVRSLVGAGFPMFASYMFEDLGVDWAASVLAFVCVALIPFPIIFWVFGKKIRSWSKFALVLDGPMPGH